MPKIVHGSTKTYTHNAGLSCCFRQWKATSHCNLMHGYALQIEVKFEGELDERNWVIDFGGLKSFKDYLEHMFDHTTLVARDDPHAEVFTEMYKKGLIDLRWVKAVGCEAFSEMIYDWLVGWIDQSQIGERVKVMEVMVREHAGNSGYTRLLHV